MRGMNMFGFKSTLHKSETAFIGIYKICEA